MKRERLVCALSERRLNDLYKKSIKVFSAAVVVSALLRILVKALFVDTVTGFYIDSLLPTVFSVMMAAGAAAIAFFTLSEKDESSGVLRGNRYLELTTAAYGIAVVAVSVPRLLEALKIDLDEPVVNRLPGRLVQIEHILGILSGIAFIYITSCLLSGAKRSASQGIVALLPVIWQTIAMIDRFISFREVSTASDQLIETLFLVCATLFLLANARCLAATAKSAKRCILWGLLSAYFGIVLVAGQGFAMMMLGSDISGPSALQNLLTVVTACYAITVSMAMAASAKQ